LVAKFCTDHIEKAIFVTLASIFTKTVEGMKLKFGEEIEKTRLLRAEIRKYRESADRSEKHFFFLFSLKEPIWLTIFGNDIKTFDFLFLYSKFAKLENSATGPSTAAMRPEIWHMFNTLVRTHQTSS